MTDSNATTTLRALLDERGVEYETDDGRFAKVTKWLALNGRLAVFAEYDSGELRFAMDSLSITPEQAIAATLGRDDCGYTEGEIDGLLDMVDELHAGGAIDYGHYSMLHDAVSTLGRDGRELPEPDGWHKCPGCGCVVGYTELYGGGWSIMMDDYQIPLNNCPSCGRPILVCDELGAKAVKR